MSNLEALFWDVDDFCVSFKAQWEKKLLSCGLIKRKRPKSLCLSEIIILLITFLFLIKRPLITFFYHYLQTIVKDKINHCVRMFQL